MILSELYSQINSAYRGSDDDVPAAGTTDAILWLLTTNRKIREWATDAKNVWESNFHLEKPSEPGTVATTATTTLTGTNTYFTDYKAGDTILVSGETVRTIATIVSDTSLTVTLAFSNTASALTFTHQSIIALGVQSYAMHRNLLNASDEIYVSTTNQNLCYLLGKPQERTRYCGEVYMSGRFPQTLTFQTTFLTGEQAISGTLKTPGYYIPNDLVNLTDLIPVDDPYWLVYSVASELAFNDLTYESKYEDLNIKANNLYSQMVSTNRRGTNNNPRVARTNVQRIRGTDYYPRSFS